MKPSIDEVARRIARLPNIHQIAFLRDIVALESPRSVRRIELELMLQDRMTKQIKKQNAADRRRA